MARTLRSRLRHEADPIKGSRFVATVAPVASEAEALALLDELRAEWPDASHHCSAWRLATPAIERASDDGEPSGSAGRPILAALVGRDVVDVAVIVTRWWGGTKLGVGGLVRAYGGTAAAALDLGEYDEWVPMAVVEFEHQHADTGAIERALAGLEVAELDIEWSTRVRRRVQLPEADVDSLWAALGDATSGRVRGPD
ncbi:MAG: YigZ family protein [Actinomycetota bacterium]